MRDSNDLGDLRSGDWERVQDVASRFERANQGGRIQDWDRFLPPRGDRLRGVVLQELIKTDLEICWRRGEQIHIEDYLKRFPELIADHLVSPRLVYEEYRARRLYE